MTIEAYNVVEMLRGIAKLTDVSTISKGMASEKIASRLLDRLEKIDEFCEKAERAIRDMRYQ